MELAAALLVDD